MYFSPYPLTVFPSCMLYINLLFCLLQRINKAHFILFNKNFPMKEGPEFAWFTNILIEAKKSKPAGMFSQKGALECSILRLSLLVALRHWVVTKMLQKGRVFSPLDFRRTFPRFSARRNGWFFWLCLWQGPSTRSKGSKFDHKLDTILEVASLPKTWRDSRRRRCEDSR